MFEGKQKCMAKFGDCCIKHAGTNTTGLAMVVRIILLKMLLLVKR